MRDEWWVNAQDLNVEQSNVIQIPGHGSYLVTGPPGSGKTNALMLRAEYLNRKGEKNYQVLVFTRALKEFLSACPGPYALPTNKLKTLSGWLMENINQFNGEISSTGDFTADRIANVETLIELLDRARVGTLIDTLLIDEAQDFRRSEIQLFRRVARDVFAVADSKQRIYEEGGGLAALREFCTELPLTYHYRNGRAICKVADQIGMTIGDYSPMVPTSMYNENDMPSTVFHESASSLDEQLAKIISSVRKELKAYPNGMIGIMAPKRIEVEAIVEAVKETEFWPLTVVQSAEETISFAEETRVCVCTIHSGKGLEFRTVHIAAANSFQKFRQEQWRMVYTGVTRAKTKLSVYYQRPVPAFLEASLEAGKEYEEPTLDDLFK